MSECDMEERIDEAHALLGELTVMGQNFADKGQEVLDFIDSEIQEYDEETAESLISSVEMVLEKNSIFS